MNQKKIAVIGAGSWGMAIAIHLARNGHGVALWDRDVQKCKAMVKTRKNPQYLASFTLPDNIFVDVDLKKAVGGVDDFFIAVPSHGFRDGLLALKPLLSSQARICWGSKGLVDGQLCHTVASSILMETIPLALLSGPSFALEVAKDLPTAVVIASKQEQWAKYWAALFHSHHFRPYVSGDVTGVELGGVVKNVLAIAVGVAAGIGYGANASAALITRGLAEMTALGLRMGGERQTFYGLSGMGDLILTATDDQSRNRRFGVAMGQGHSVEEAKAKVGQVVEGARNAKEVFTLAKKHEVSMPITEQVYAMIYKGLSPKTAVDNLLSRDIGEE